MKKLSVMILFFGLIMITMPVHVPAKDDTESISTFMSKVLEKRIKLWTQLYDYVFYEKETLSIYSESQHQIVRKQTQEWTWFVRDGYMVRSPSTINGAVVSDEQRKRKEEEWIENIKNRRDKGDDREKFFGINLETGKYYFAGYDNLNSEQVAVVEYLPYSQKESKEANVNRRDGRTSLEISANDATMVVMRILPETHQIVEMEMDFSKLDLGFVKWFLKLNDAKLKLEMIELSKDFWVPVRIQGSGVLDSAADTVRISYQKEFHDYSQAAVKVKFKFDPVAIDGEDDEKKK